MQVAIRLKVIQENSKPENQDYIKALHEKGRINGALLFIEKDDLEQLMLKHNPTRVDILTPSRKPCASCNLPKQAPKEKPAQKVLRKISFAEVWEKDGKKILKDTLKIALTEGYKPKIIKNATKALWRLGKAFIKNERVLCTQEEELAR